MKAAIIAAAAIAVAGTAAEGETWNLPTADPASTFHVENPSESAACMREGLGRGVDHQHPSQPGDVRG